MKRALTGMPAYSSILSAELPEKTKTYTPIKHSDIIDNMRKEIEDAGFKIIEETYKSSNEGKIALGTFRLEYKSDPDIELCANFVNSYNKQYAFRFNLGGINKLNGTSMIINNSNLGAYKRVHKGDADILAKGKITDFIGDAGEYWDALMEHKDMMKDIQLTEEVRDMILGKLFFSDDVLNGLQMNIVHKEISKPSYSYKEDLSSCWVLYNHIAIALKESRPATWITDQMALHQAFDDVINFSSKARGASVVTASTTRLYTSGEVEKVIGVSNPAQVDLEDSIAEVEAEAKPVPPCSGHAVMSQEEEDAANERMNVIGRNGNDGLHYDEVNEEEFPKEKKKSEFFEFFGPGDGTTFEIWKKGEDLYKIPMTSEEEPIFEEALLLE